MTSRLIDNRRYLRCLPGCALRATPTKLVFLAGFLILFLARQVQPADTPAQTAVPLIKLWASLPLDANVQFMTIIATKMPYIGRG